MSVSVPSASSSPPLPMNVNVRLSAMMFLQYAIWGAWLPILLPFLKNHRHFDNTEIGQIFAVGAVGAILAPFVAGQIADRYFATERFLGVSHLLGAVVVWQLAAIESYQAFLAFSLLYSIIYSPTLSLTNSLAFHHIPDRDRDFGRVRVWGTIGWIIAGIAVGQWLLWRYSPPEAPLAEIELLQAAGRADAFRLSAVLGLLMGVFCFFLPHTPPQKGKQAFATWEARGEVQRNPRLLALFLFSIVISCIHQFYFVHTAEFLSQYQRRAETLVELINRVFGVGGGGMMTIGQISEIFVLAAIPFVAKRCSRKTLLSVGIVAYVLRMVLFAYVDTLVEWIHVSAIPILLLGVALHGLCFGCFIFVAFMIVDEETTPDVRASAQSLYNLVVVGFGIIVGSVIAAGVADWATHDGVLDYRQLFGAAMWAGLLTLVAFGFLYPPGGPHQTEAPR